MKINADQLYNVVSETTIDSWVKIMSQCPKIQVNNNSCHGIDKNHLLYKWFLDKIFPVVKNILGDDIFPIFGMYLNETVPWGMHTDAYHIKEHPDKIPAYSILFPYSVNNQKNLVEKSNTIICNECIDDNKKEFWDQLTDKSNDANNALSIFEQHLSHNDISKIKKLTINKTCKWELGSMIYWESHMIHDSDNFIRNGYNSKQAIVIHTYYLK